MSDVDTKALRALLDKATPGPWEADGRSVESIATVAFCGESTAMHVGGRHRHINAEEAASNAALIAAAVNALPELLAIAEENARLRALLADAASELWERGMVRGDELLDKIDAELRKPDAAD